MLQWAAAALVALVFLMLPNWVGNNMISIPRTHGSLVYQAHLRQGMNDLVKRFGGADKVLACGSVMTEGFQVPMVAFMLDVPTTRIEAPPTLGGARTQSRRARAQPDPADARHALGVPAAVPEHVADVHYHYVGTAGPVHMFTQGCSGGSA